MDIGQADVLRVKSLKWQNKRGPKAPNIIAISEPTYSIGLKLNSPPSLIPEGQRDVTVFVRV